MESLFCSQIPALKLSACEFIFLQCLAGSCFASYPPNCHSKIFKDIHQTLQNPELLMDENSLWNLQHNKLNTAQQLDASELGWCQGLSCSLPTALTEVTLEFAPSFNLPQRRLCSCRDPWRSQSWISCQLFLWVQGQPLLTLGLSVTCHILFSIWIHGHQASWELRPLQGILSIDLWLTALQLLHIFLEQFGYQGLMDIEAGSPGVSSNILLPQVATWFIWSAGTFLQVWFFLQKVGVKAHGLEQIPQRSCEQQREPRGSCRQLKTLTGETRWMNQKKVKRKRQSQRNERRMEKEIEKIIFKKKLLKNWNENKDERREKKRKKERWRQKKGPGICIKKNTCWCPFFINASPDGDGINNNRTSELQNNRWNNSSTTFRLKTVKRVWFISQFFFSFLFFFYI